MSVQIVKFPQPKVYLSLVAGGSLTIAQTYYFLGFFQVGNGLSGGARGACSEEMSITPTSGNQSIKAEWWQDGGDITAFADAGSGQITVSALAHGRSNGDTVSVRGTTNYDGDYTIANVSTNSFEITATWVSDDGASKWFADDGLPTLASGIQFRWDKYTMIDSGTGNPYHWLNENDPTYTSQNITNGPQKWSHRYSYPGFSGSNNTWVKQATAYNTNEDELHDGLIEGTTYRARAIEHPQIAKRIDRYPNPASFPEDQGVLLIYLDNNSTNTEDHIISALKASGYDDMFLLEERYKAKPRLNVLGGLLTESGATNTITEVEITFEVGGIRTTDQEWTVTDSVLECRGGELYSYAMQEEETWVNSKLVVYGTNLSLNGDEYVFDNLLLDVISLGMYYYSYSGLSIKQQVGGNELMEWRYSNLLAIGPTLSDFNIDGLYIYMYYNGGGYLDVDIKMEDVAFSNSGKQNYDIASAFGNMSGRACAFTHTCKNITSDRANGKVLVAFVNTTTPTSIVETWYFNFDIELTILDIKGNPIEGVTIKMTDEDGGVDTDTSDSNGEGVVTGLSYTIEYDSADTDGFGFYSKTSDFKKLCLEITKSGYKQYEVCDFTLQEGKKWTITLKPNRFREIKSR